MARKRKQRFGKMVKYRYYQLGALVGGMFFYIMVYRKFLYPKPVLYSTSYYQAVDFIQANKKVRSKIGS